MFAVSEFVLEMSSDVSASGLASGLDEPTATPVHVPHARSTAQLSSPPVGMGGEESVAFRGAFIFCFRMGNSSDIVFCSQV